MRTREKEQRSEKDLWEEYKCYGQIEQCSVMVTASTHQCLAVTSSLPPLLPDIGLQPPAAPIGSAPAVESPLWWWE